MTHMDRFGGGMDIAAGLVMLAGAVILIIQAATNYLFEVVAVTSIIGGSMGFIYALGYLSEKVEKWWRGRKSW